MNTMRLTVGLAVLALAALPASADDAEVRKLRAENNLLKAAVQQRDRQLAEVRTELEGLKALDALCAEARNE